MKSWANRQSYHQLVHQNLTTEDADVPPPVLDDDLAQWLGQLTLLYGVPVEYLVPDHRMLPAESIRFFYLDRNWLDRMVDGAMSVGVLSTKEQIFNKSFFEDIYTQIDAAQQQVRAYIRDEPVVVPDKIGGTMTGLLMRSRVVSDYPGVEINAYDSDCNLLKVLRMDRLSDSLILCIFQGVPDQVDFIEPSEGLHFGIQNDNQTGENYTYLRGLGFPTDKPRSEGGYPAGAQIDQPAGSQSDFAKAEVKMLGGDASKGVIDVMATVANIEQVLKNLPGNALKDPATGKDELTAGGFAISMVVTAGLQSYRMTAPNGDTPDTCGSTSPTTNN